MTIRTVFTCLLNEASAFQLTAAASDMAAKYDAHLIGQRTHEAVVVYPGVALHISGPS